MAGVVQCVPSSNKNNMGDHRMVGGVYVVADDESDSDENDDNEAGQNRNPLPKHICDLQCAGLPIMRKKPKKKSSKSRSVSVATHGGSTSSRRPMDLMCSQFPSDGNSNVGVDVSCGAMNAFSNDVPYHSAGLSLAMSVDTNPGGFLSQNTRRRRRPTLISSMPSSPTLAKNNDSTIRRRLMTSSINLPTGGKRGSFRSSSPGVERFNYAKALLRSDHELEKLSRKIRSEINESELFELAQAAQKAADLGVDNFSGKASTFGGELRRHGQEGITYLKTGLPVIQNCEPLIANHATTNSSAAQLPRPSRREYGETEGKGKSGSKIDYDSRNPIGFSEQSLLEQARAAAAAVVVATPSVQLQKATANQMRKEPERRSMRIDSLRDINEVIPQWKELHGHMRTHFRRANVNTNSLFFRERECSPSQSKSCSSRNALPSSFIEPKESKSVTSHRRAKSFFDNIAGIKLLPDFRPKKSPQKSQHDDDCSQSNANDGKGSDTVETRGYGAIPFLHMPPKKAFGRVQSHDRRVPPGSIQPNETNDETMDEGTSSECDNMYGRQGQATSLIPRLPRRPESFDLEVLQVTENLPAPPHQSSDCQKIGKDDDGDIGADYSRHAELNRSPKVVETRRIERDSIASSPEGKRESSLAMSDHESICPVSPSNDPNLVVQSHSQFVGPSSPIAPSTPKNIVKPQRKESGFSTPAHLRMIKRLHGSTSDEKISGNNAGLERPKSDDLEDFETHDIATPAIDIYTQFEPNSIVRNTPAHIVAAPSLHNERTTHLALPSIQTSKSENDLQKMSRTFVRRKVRTQRQNDQTLPPESPTIFMDSVLNTDSDRDKNGADLNDKALCSVTNLESLPPQKESEAETSGNSRPLSPSKLICCINPPHEVPALQDPYTHSLFPRTTDNSTESSVQKIQFGKEVDEKKECDSVASSSGQMSHNEKSEVRSNDIEHQQYNLDVFSVQNDKESKSNLRRKHPSPKGFEDKALVLRKKTINCLRDSPHIKNERTVDLQNRNENSKLVPRTNLCEKESSAALALKKIDSNHTAESKDFLSSNSIQGDNKNNGRNYACDGSNGDNLSVCHSLPSTDVTFKTAVQTVQGVAVQTVQEVFSHLSLGSPKNLLQSKEWQSEDENKEFLSNYFYCAKAGAVDKVSNASTIQDSVKGSNPPDANGEGLACIEPCNGRDPPCYLYGFDTMCGGLIDLLPHDANDDSNTLNQRKQETDGVLSQPAVRDRSSSISMGQLHRSRRHTHSSSNSLQHQDEGSWLGMFQRVASDRFKFQFHTEENELEKSRHPYTPPCLSRRTVPARNQTL